LNQNKLLIRNAASGTVMQIAKLFLNFVVRTIFIHTLGNQALGLNGLFTNILSLLSLTELGFGAAVVTHMYKPIAEQNHTRIRVLMGVYRTIYLGVGAMVAILGLMLVPFIPTITRTYTGSLNVEFIFFLYVANIVFSYTLGYRTSMLTADQRGYVVNITTLLGFLMQSFMQVIVLFVFRSFYLYLVVAILATVFQNLYLSYRVKKDYPYLRGQKKRASIDDLRSVMDYAKPLLVYQVSGVVNNSTDSIVISQFLSVAMTGLYSNYMMIVSALLSLMTAMVSAITSTIGNLAAARPHDLYQAFKRIFSVISSVSIFVGFCLGGLLNPFIVIWLGDASSLNWLVSGSFAINLFVTLIGLPLMVFREATGSFVYRRYIPIISVVINLVVSVILVNFLGVGGVIIGTLTSRLLTYTWNDPDVIFKHHFRIRPRGFLIRIYRLILIMAILIFGEAFLVSRIQNWTFLRFVILSVLVVGVSVFVSYMYLRNKVSIRELIHGKII